LDQFFLAIRPEQVLHPLTTALTMRAVFHLALRQTEGLIGSVTMLLGLAFTVPDHSTMCRRGKTLVCLRFAGPKPARSISSWTALA
jgi:hypothetical protein